MGISHYMMHEFDKAKAALERAMTLESTSIAKAMIQRWMAQAGQRLGKSVELDPGLELIVSTFDYSWHKYAEGHNKFAANDGAGAMEIWRNLADSDDWTSIWVIAAEAEVAALEGAKNMKPSV